MIKQVKIAVNICTYKRQEYLLRNLSKLLASNFFNEGSLYFDGLHIFVVDNASEISLDQNERVHLIYNKNTGGSGGFQRGIEEIRKYDNMFTHVLFMDDDVDFDISAFYTLYDFLGSVDESNKKRPVAGRMLAADNRDVQWTAGEIWNGGNIEHVEFLRNIKDTSNPYVQGKAIYDSGAEYGGWWFCCYPMSYVRDNDALPFFLHCDDVEYGLRCDKSPIIIEGVHVWHEIFAARQTPVISYYDWRNSRIVNAMYGFDRGYEVEYKSWKEQITKFHLDKDYFNEHMLIMAMRDYLRGPFWFRHVNSERLHKRICRFDENIEFTNKFWWRFVAVKMHFRYSSIVKSYEKLRKSMAG